MTSTLFHIGDEIEFRDQFNRWRAGRFIGMRGAWFVIKVSNGEYEIAPRDVRPLSAHRLRLRAAKRFKPRRSGG